MRFLFGLIVGALATLFVAAALDAPADRLVGELLQVPARASEVFSEVFDADDGLPEPIVVLADDSSDQTKDEPQDEPTTVPPAGILPEATADLTAQEAVVQEPLVREELGEPQLPEPLLPQSAAAVQHQAVAWAPFHSEASANGYARRLSRETGRAFTVKKRAPADYAVVFSYIDDADLASAQAQITAVTGITQP